MKFVSILTLLALAMVLLHPVAAQVFKPDNKTGDVAWDRKDYATALKHYRPLAEQGNAGGQFRLGAAYDLGRGVTKDKRKAARFYRKAAIQGKSAAQRNLGRMYRDGEGILQDLVMAYVWLNIAAANGDKFGSSDERDDVRAVLNSPERKLARILSQRCFKKPKRCPEYSED
jgi:uncharacterized protein